MVARKRRAGVGRAKRGSAASLALSESSKGLSAATPQPVQAQNRRKKKPKQAPKKGAAVKKSLGTKKLARVAKIAGKVIGG